jgi:predicted metal-dependent phosphoesterase TrpH
VTPVTIADLHTHTTASDGRDEPVALVHRAEALRLGAIAITDHDTVDAHLALRSLPDPTLTIIPRIEMSANVGMAEVHVLGYFIDVSSAYLTDQLHSLQQQRLRRVERFCARLTDLGLPLTIDEVLAQATGESVGRPHVARAMIERGYVPSVDQAFDRYLSGGRPAFVPRDDVTPESSIDLIHASGGVAILAHPYTTGDPAGMVDRLLQYGLDGVEVEYGSYDQAERARLRELALARSLIPTGGSDFHGPDHRESTPLGAGGVSLDIVDRLRERSERYQ